jgi:hypothetical protein
MSEKNLQQLTTYRLQVKSSRLPTRQGPAKNPSVSSTLSRLQLSSPQEIELLYMLLVRDQRDWRSFIIPRARLNDIDKLYLAKRRSGPGRPPKTDEDAATDGLTLTLTLNDNPTAWGVSFIEFTQWPRELPELPLGPGAVTG